MDWRRIGQFLSLLSGATHRQETGHPSATSSLSCELTRRKAERQQGRRRTSNACSANWPKSQLEYNWNIIGNQLGLVCLCSTHTFPAFLLPLLLALHHRFYEPTRQLLAMGAHVRPLARRRAWIRSLTFPLLTLSVTLSFTIFLFCRSLTPFLFLPTRRATTRPSVPLLSLSFSLLHRLSSSRALSHYNPSILHHRDHGRQRQGCTAGAHARYGRRARAQGARQGG